jgi:hypothetical protein
MWTNDMAKDKKQSCKELLLAVNLRSACNDSMLALRLVIHVDEVLG